MSSLTVSSSYVNLEHCPAACNDSRTSRDSRNLLARVIDIVRKFPVSLDSNKLVKSRRQNAYSADCKSDDDDAVREDTLVNHIKRQCTSRVRHRPHAQVLKQQGSNADGSL